MEGMGVGFEDRERARTGMETNCTIRSYVGCAQRLDAIQAIMDDFSFFNTPALENDEFALFCWQ
jgi:hypothetical protein